MLEQSVRIVFAEERISAIENSIAELKELVKSLRTENNSIGDFISEEEAQRLTGLGKTSLYQLRKTGQLSQTTISGRGVFYRKSDLEIILESNEKRA